MKMGANDGEMGIMDLHHRRLSHHHSPVLFRLLPLIFMYLDWITTVLPVVRMEKRQIQAIENPRLGEAGVS